MEQIKHAIETGAMRAGEQLPGIRKLAEELVINPNTIAKVYRELEHEGVIELRQGAGAFVAERKEAVVRPQILRALPLIRNLIAKLAALNLSEEEMRRLFEAELANLRENGLPKATSKR
jgi:GntR family transcriptional regulator